MTLDGQDQSLHQNKCHHRVQCPQIILKQIIQSFVVKFIIMWLVTMNLIYLHKFIWVTIYLNNPDKLSLNNISANAPKKIALLFLTNLSFIHIPKTGGTMIEKLFAAEYNIQLGNEIGNNLMNVDFNCPKHHVPLNHIFQYSDKHNVSFQKISPYYSKFIRDNRYFTIVRNPYSRYISQYKYCVANNWGCLKIFWTFLKKYCSKYIDDHTFCKNINSQTLNFCEVDNFNKISHVLLKYLIANNSNMIMRCHYVPQTEYIYYYNNTSKQIVKTNNILRTEHLSNDLVKLLQKYNSSKNIDSNIINKYVEKSKYPTKCQNLTRYNLSVE
eukprot:62460_1